MMSWLRGLIDVSLSTDTSAFSVMLSVAVPSEPMSSVSLFQVEFWPVILTMPTEFSIAPIVTL